MRSRLLPAAVIALAACLPAGHARAQTIGSYQVVINGAGSFESDLRKFLDIEQHKNDRDMTRGELERLLAAAPDQAREILATGGYFSPRIQPQLVQQNGHWLARLNVDPGAPTEVTSVDIRFSGGITQGPHQNERRVERLKRQWPLTPGNRFTQKAWDGAKGELLKGLLVRDFPAAHISDSEARIDPDKHSAALMVLVDSGPFFTFGKLQIQGLQRYSPDQIERLNPIHPGEPYAQEKLTELQTRLQESPYFKTAFATTEIDPAHPDEVPVRVDVTENKRNILSAGVGFSTDNGARIQGKWTDRLFLGHEWLLDSQLLLDRQTRLLGTDLYFPARKNGWRPSLSTHYQRTDISNELNNTLRTDARMTSPNRNDEQVWGTSYLIERHRVADTPAITRRALVGTYSYTRRRIDNLLVPTRGYVGTLEVDAGPNGLVNMANIGRLYGRIDYLSPKRHKLQAVLRAEYGQVFGAPREEVPSDLLFRTGGDRSVRGYAYQTLGVQENGAVVGGRVLGVASAELVYYFLPAWGVAVFHDAGNAADSWSQFKFAQSTGVGVRWSGPIGPVSVDLAFAQETRKPRLHFTIGYGF